MRTKTELYGTAVLAALVVGFYVYLASGYRSQPWGFSADSVRYYHLLVDGFRSGQLSLPVDPPPELAKLADPYDPVQRGNLGMHDASYYKGRYYLYFGVGPALVLFLPFRILTGVHFSENLAVALFCALGFFSSLALLRGLRRRFHPDCPGGLMLLCVLVLGLGNLAPVMLVRSDFWEVPIAAAYGFSCLALLAMWRGTAEGASSHRWFAIASAAFGIAVASRPHFVFAGAILGFVWIWRWRQPVRRSASTAATELVALVGPLAGCVAALLLYNYLRFDDPLEFGQKYQVGGVSMRWVPAMDWRYIPINFYANFLAPAQFERYFPFVQVIRGYPGKVPALYFGQENPFGVLVNLPVVWLALLALTTAWRRRHAEPELGFWVIMLSWHFCTVAGLVMLFAGATNRYLVDFLPTLLLLSTMGLVAAGEAARSARWRRVSVGFAALVVTALASAFSVCATLRYNGLFKLQHPQAYARLAQMLNRPVYWWESRHPGNYGPVEIVMKFPKDKPGRPEPIMITGVAHLSDYLYVIYDAFGRSIQLAYDRTNHEHVVSQPIPLDYDVPHRIAIESGSLFPETPHPFFTGWLPEAVRAAKQTLRVTLDGVPFLVGNHEFFGATPEQVSIGTNPLSENGGKQFTGNILSIRRAATAPAVADFLGEGSLSLALVLPNGTPGRQEPLLATGARGSGDLLFVRYEDPTHIRLGFHHEGEEPMLSGSLEYVPGRIQLLAVSFGSFYPRPRQARERELAGMLVVRFNGRPVWLEKRSFHAMGMKPAIGANDWDGSVSPSFSGQIVAQHSAPVVAEPDSPFVVEPYWLETGTSPNWGPVRMRLLLPSDQLGKGEPLLVSGTSAAQGDYLWINYPVAGQVLVGYEHTGSGGPHTGLVPLDYAQPLTLEFSLPSLFPPGTSKFFGSRSLLEIASLTSRARLKLNGQVRFDAEVGAFESPPESVTFGENRISQAFGVKFTGQILSIERGRFDPPDGLTGNKGELEMTISFSENATGRETLLSTGPAAAPDSLLIDYVSSGRVRFVAKAAVGAEIAGDAVELAPGRKHILRIVWGGLDPIPQPPGAGGESSRAPRAFAITVNGKPALAGRLEFQLQTPQPIAFGAPFGNSLHPFSGLLHSIRRTGK